MATVRDPVKPEPVAKYETLVETKLAQARGRIRALDLTAAFLGLVIATMAFGLVMVLLDRWFHLSTLFRQIAFSVYGVAALVYLVRVVAWPLFRRVNPYYAAIQVEHCLPAAKNSVVNWLDLRQQSLPPAIKGAVSHRAALDISRADLDEAVSPRQVLWLGGAAVALFLIVLGVALFGPGLGRIFQPFSPANRTELVIVKPEGGNATVSVGRAVSFEVVAQGRRPDSLRLLYRYEQNVPYEERPMEAGDAAGQWLLTMPAFEVKNPGFWYKVAGGDAETEEYRVQVRSTPLITGFEVTYQPRPYTRLPNATSADPNLKGLRGTAVQLVTRTNRKIRYDRSGLVFSDATKDSIAAEPVPGNPQAMQFHLVLDKDGSYVIRFTSDEGESNTDPISYSIKVEPDQPPVVVLTKPEEEMISLPANEVLVVEGSANDDFGITGFTLRMQTNPKDGSPKEPLPPKPYRPGKSFRFPDGGYPGILDYKDFVELNKIRQGNGQPLQPGMVMEYWLEATDNCDFPAANVGRSRSKFVTIVEPAKDQEQVAKQKTEARKKQQQHEAEQDKQLEQQGQQGREGPPQQDGNPQAGDPQAGQGEGQDPNKQGQPQAGQGDGQDQPKEGNPQPRPGENNPQAGQGDSRDPRKEGNPQARQGEGQDQNKQADLKRVEQKLENELRKQEAAEGHNANPGNPQPNNLGEGQPKPDENQPNQPQPDPKDGQPNAKNGPEKEKADKKREQGQDAPGGADKAPPKPEEDKQGAKPTPDGKPGRQDGSAKPNDRGEQPNEEVKRKEGQEPIKPKENPPDGKKEMKDKPKVNNPANPTDNSKASNKAPKKNDEGDGQGQDQAAPDAAKDKGKPDAAQNKNNKSEKGNEAKDAGNKPPQGGANPDTAPQKPEKPKPGQDNNPPGKDEKPGKDSAQPNKDKGKPDKQAKPNPQATPGTPKEGNGKQPGPGQPMDKPGANKPGTENKDDNLQKQIDDLAKAMKSGDPKAREEARKKLEDLSKNAKEESDRKAAGECLKGNSGSNGKKEGQGAGPGENKGGKEGKEASAGKPGDTPDKKDQKRQGGQPGAKGEGTDDHKGAQSKESGKGEAGKQPGKPGSNPSGSTQGERWDPANQGSNAEAEPGSEANKEFQKRAGVMQLEAAKKRLKELKEKANDEFLKKADVTKGELLDYLKHEQERLQRLEAQLKQDKAPNPKRPGGTLPNLRVRRVQSGDKKDDLPHATKADPPPELREASEEFNQLLAKPERSREKK